LVSQVYERWYGMKLCSRQRAGLWPAALALVMSMAVVSVGRADEGGKEKDKKTDQQGAKAKVQVQVEVGKPGGPQRRAIRIAAPEALSKYWIGLLCRPLDDALRAHLDLPKDQGLVVLRVIDDSAAETAGLKRHDILLEADGKKLNSSLSLMQLLKETQDKQIELLVVRGGQRQAVKVKPTERPERHRRSRGWPAVPMHDLQRWAENFVPHEHGPMRLRVFGRGAMFGKDGELPPLPEGVTVEIHKQGDQPTKIKVAAGDESWEVEVGGLDKLPEKYRDAVRRMLSAPAIALRAPGPPGVHHSFRHHHGHHRRSDGDRHDRHGDHDRHDGRRDHRRDHGRFDRDGDRDDRFERLEKRLEKLSEEVEKLKGKAAEEK